MRFVWIIATVFLLNFHLKAQDYLVLPLRDTACFDVKIIYEFKSRNEVSSLQNNLIEMSKTQTSSVLPYLEVEVYFKCNSNDLFVRLINEMANEKVKYKYKDKPIRVNFGFIADVRDGVSNNKYHLISIAGKQEVDRIELFVDSLGNFYVNGVQNGKF